MPSVTRRRDYLLKVCLLIGAALLIALSGFTGSIGLVAAVLLLIIFAAATTENVYRAVCEVRIEKRHGEAPEQARGQVDGKTVAWQAAMFLLGAAGIVIGADLLVSCAEYAAIGAGVSERVISVTVLAVGTPLPELVTTLTAIVKKEASLSAGNIIGANIMDLTLIMPICMLASGTALPVTPVVGRLDLPACLSVSCVALIPALITKRFSRWQGVVLLALYAVSDSDLRVRICNRSLVKIQEKESYLCVKPP